jgi:chorismate synthase
VITIGEASVPDPLALSYDDVRAIPSDAPLHCVDRSVEQQMIAAIDRAREAGDTMGGAFEVIAHAVPPGLGTYVQWDRKLDGRLAQALMSIPAIKAIGFGRGPAVATLPGSRVHDEIVSAGGRPTPVGVARPTNNAGGLEGGVTNGEDLRVTAAIERSDVCAVPAAAVVGEAMVAIVLADALIEKFGGDSVQELVVNWKAFQDRTSARFVRR